MPLLVFVSACGGLLGSAFNVGKRRMLSWRRRRYGIGWHMAEGAAAAAITAAALIGLPAAFGTCLDIPEAADVWEAADVMQYGCSEKQYNDLATALLSSSVWTIRTLLSMGSDAEPVNNRVRGGSAVLSRLHVLESALPFAFVAASLPPPSLQCCACFFSSHASL